MFISRRGLIAFLSLSFLSWPICLHAAETPAGATNLNIDVTAEPVRYSFVSGDESRFRALHWIDEGFVTGVKDFTAKEEFADNVSLETEGHAIPEEADYSGFVSLKKEDVGYINFDYNQFRKYYSNGGGFYRPFTSLSQNYTDKELALDIGKFGVEAGLTMPHAPMIVLNYDRDYKQGTKSRLSWADVRDTAVGVIGSPVQKKIAPSWQNIDEIVDSFGARISDTFAGFNWKAQQNWEYVRTKNMREEKNLSANTAPTSALGDANQKIRDQYTEPRSDLITTTLGLDRWFSKERVFVSSGYRFSQMDSRELENIFELNQNGVPMTFSNAEQVRDAHSDNLYTSQTWVGSIMTNLSKGLGVISKMKVEAIRRHSESTYPKDLLNGATAGTDAAPVTPDGIVDQITVSENQEKVMRYGEGVSIRYTGIPRLAVYNDYDFEQAKSNLYEDRRSVSASEVFNRQDITHMNRFVGTLGGQFVPWNQFTMTLQGRYRVDDIDYDHVRYTSDSSTTAKSVFIDAQDIRTDEVSAKFAYRPCRWFQPAFRYQLQDKGYKTWGLPSNDVPVDTALVSSIYTWDLTSQPLDDLLLTASFSYQDGKIITPDRFSVTRAAIPSFSFDSYNSLFSAEYSLTKDLVLTGTADYIRAANFVDFSAIGMPYGADFHEVDATVGLRWTAKKDLTIEPKYAWYQYRANEAEVGSFNAQVIWLEVNSKW